MEAAAKITQSGVNKASPMAASNTFTKPLRISFIDFVK
jgi:hypothetical protein